MNDRAWLGFRPEEEPFDPCEFGNFRSQSHFLADDSSLEFLYTFASRQKYK